jgi:SpoVK/Ycf46/Vps4 family AAA+-type ATPase
MDCPIIRLASVPRPDRCVMPIGSSYFRTSLDHLMAEVRRIELKLLVEIKNARLHNGNKEDDLFRGLYISESEVDSLVIGATTIQDSPAGKIPPDSLSELLRQTEAFIRQARMESLHKGIVLRLNELGRHFSLSPFEVDALLVCLLPELELKYQKLYAYVQDDATKKSPTIDLVLRLLCDSPAQRLAQREVFSSQSPLLKYALLRTHDDHPSRPTLLLGKLLQVDERIISYLLGADQMDTRLGVFASLVRPTLTLSDMVLDDGLYSRLMALTQQFKEASLVCSLYGPRGVGKKSVAEALCHNCRMPILKVELSRIYSADIPFEQSVMLTFREGRLQQAAIYLDGFDRLFDDDKAARSCYQLLVEQIRHYPHWVFLSGERDWRSRGLWPQKRFVSVNLPDPPYSQRKRLWQKYTSPDLLPAPDGQIDDIASRFRLVGGQIRDAVEAARTTALWRNGQDQLNISDLFAACRRESTEILDTQTRKILPKYTWEDIVLPRDQMEQLREICGFIKHRHTVYSEWGFEAKLSSGKGLNVLFAGPSGTGKTMAAEVMANELSLDLYKIDLSAIVSKYIGETEKNLKQVFQEGQASNAILFFDEADALFGKRSEVRDSHDRYANIEIAYLLQRTEEYEGIVILATNLRKNIDEAFTRRMHSVVDFPMPEEQERHSIWQRVFPAGVPLSKDVDLGFLARQFKISGGNIKNIALNAAFLAAEDGGCVSMENLIRATKREYQKMGKLCTEGDFAAYFELVRG